MISAFPMYDFDDMVAANAALWARVRDRLQQGGIAAPKALTRGADLWQLWLSPDLMLAQTCGYPFRARLHPDVTLVGTPDYGIDGCAPGEYCSYFVARRDDRRRDLAAFDGVDLAYNDALSQSGWAAPQHYATVQGLRFPAGAQTGGHRLTVQAVASGRAALGAIDAVTWRHLQRMEPATQDLHVIAQTAPTPGLPLITHKAGPAKQLFAAVTDAIALLPDADRAILGLRGLVAIPASAYLSVPNPPPPVQIAQ